MIYSKTIRKAIVILAVATAILTVVNTVLTITNTVRISRLAERPEASELVTVRRQDVDASAEVLSEEETVPVRIDCPLDDETQQMILDRCEELGLDFSFVMGLIFRESSFRTNADSGSSVGLMQIHRMNHEWLSEELGVTDFFDAEQNVKSGTYILDILFDKYNDPAMVLMAYNMGETGARKLWNKGIYTSAYAESVLQQADKYNQEITERMGENGQV